MSPVAVRTPPSVATELAADAKLTAGAGRRPAFPVPSPPPRKRWLAPSYENESVAVPATPPTVTTSGSATPPMHTVLVDDDHDSVEHSAEPSRPEGVASVKAKLRPMTEMLLDVAEATTFITDARVLTAGAEQKHG